MVEQIGILTLAGQGPRPPPVEAVARIEALQRPLPDGALRMILEASLPDLLKSGRRPISNAGILTYRRVASPAV